MAMLLKEIHEQPSVIENLRKNLLPDTDNINMAGKKVFLFGTGASLSACMQAKYSFLRYAGINAIVVPACEAAYYLTILDGDCMVFIVSQSGESYETKVICNKLLEKSIWFAAITNCPDSYLGKHANVCFYLNAGEELGTATKTQTASLVLLYLIAAGRNLAAMEQIKNIPSAMEQTLQLAEGYKKQFGDFIGNRKTVYITGLDAHAPTALQASLMLKEKVWLHAEGLALAEFRHGPVEVLEQGIPVILIGHGEEKTDTLLGHANFLSEICNADVVLVTNRKERNLGGYVNFPYKWNGDEELSHICATLPFQLLSESMASERNYNIDGFKYIGKILDQYEKPMNQKGGYK